MANKFRVGQEVKVVNVGEQYTTYANWFDAYEAIPRSYAARYAYGVNFPENAKDLVFKIVECGKHTMSSDDTLYLIEVSDEYLGPLYLIGENGLEEVVSEKNLNERMKMVKAMEYIVRQINNEEIFMDWLSEGVADGDIDYGDLVVTVDDKLNLEYYVANEHFAQLMDLFLVLMKSAKHDGGLYCGDVVSGEG